MSGGHLSGGQMSHHPYSLLTRHLLTCYSPLTFHLHTTYSSITHYFTHHVITTYSPLTHNLIPPHSPPTHHSLTTHSPLTPLTHHSFTIHSPLSHPLLTTYLHLTYHLKLDSARIYWHGWGDEMQNKAEAQPAWLQLAAGAGSWA